MDFNIKGFLLEMRNKHSSKPSGDGFINIVDEQSVGCNSPSDKARNQQFAMIIEENTPKGQILGTEEDKSN